MRARLGERRRGGKPYTASGARYQRTTTVQAERGRCRQDESAHANTTAAIPATPPSEVDLDQWSSTTMLLRGGRVRDVPATITANTDIRLFRVPDEALEHAQPRAILPDHRRRRIGQHPLIRAGLKKLPHPEAARVARRFESRQSMIRADDLVAKGHISAGPKEQRAVVGHIVQEIVRIRAHDLHVFRLDSIGFLDPFLACV